jgi:hypothetical protein
VTEHHKYRKILNTLFVTPCLEGQVSGSVILSGVFFSWVSIVYLLCRSKAPHVFDVTWKWSPCPTDHVSLTLVRGLGGLHTWCECDGERTYQEPFQELNPNFSDPPTLLSELLELTS